MKNILTVLLGITFLMQCGKVDDYCPNPPKVTNASEFGSGGGLLSPHDPTKKFKIQLAFEFNPIGEENSKTMYSFSTPDCFINPKGDFTEVIVDRPEYIYILKDTANPPSSVDVYIYSFNDCGRTEAFKTTITYN